MQPSIAPASITSAPHCQSCGAEVPTATHRYGWSRRPRTCKDCKKRQQDVRRDRWKAAHPGRNEELMREWHASHRDHRREYNRGRKENDNARRRERRAVDPSYREREHAQYERKYAKDKEAFVRRAAKRRAVERNAEGSYTTTEVRALYAASGGQCFWCDTPVGTSYHLDHLIPLSRGGTNDAGNLVVACQRCNNRKYNLLPLDFAERLLSEAA